MVIALAAEAWASVGVGAGSAIFTVTISVILWRRSRRDNKLDKTLADLDMQIRFQQQEHREDYRHLDSKFDKTDTLLARTSDLSADIAQLKGAEAERNRRISQASLGSASVTRG